MISIRSEGNKLLLFLGLFLFSACSQDSIYRAEPFNASINLNALPDSSKPVFSQRHLKSNKEKWVGGIFGRNQLAEWNEVLYKDTVIRIDPQVESAFDTGSSAYPSAERSQFDFFDVTFVNPAKTSFIARISGPNNVGNRFYLFNAQVAGLKVYSIDRPTIIEGDRKWENRGMLQIGPELLMVDNDYIFNQKTGKAFEITREGRDRIRGEFTALSPDQQTVTFTTNHLLYQCHFPSGKVYSESIANEVLATKVKKGTQTWPYDYFNWVKDGSGRMFLKSEIVNTNHTR